MDVGIGTARRSRQPLGPCRHVPIPLRSNGGLHYQRNAAEWDSAGNYACVNAHTSNAAIEYARLYGVRGKKSIWDNRGPKARLMRGLATVSSFGWIVFARTGMRRNSLWWQPPERGTLQPCVRTATTISMLPVGVYGVYPDGKLLQTSEVPVLGHNLTVLLAIIGQNNADYLSCAPRTSPALYQPLRAIHTVSSA